MMCPFGRSTTGSLVFPFFPFLLLCLLFAYSIFSVGTGSGEQWMASMPRGAARLHFPWISVLGLPSSAKSGAERPASAEPKSKRSHCRLLIQTTYRLGLRSVLGRGV